MGIAAYAVWGGAGLNKARQAVPDAGLKQPKSSAAEVAKMVAAGNPNLEVIYADEDSGKIAFSEKSTGRIATPTVEEARAGKISFEGAAAGAMTPPPAPAVNSAAPPMDPPYSQSPPAAVPYPQSPPGPAAPRYGSPETIVARARSIAVLQTDGDPAIQDALVNNLTKWGGMAVMSDPGRADLILEVRQTGGLPISNGSNRASATLIHRASGRQLWGGAKGGTAFSGLSKGLVGRAIAKDVIKYVDRYRRR
jgi:hypothetical protein